MTAQKSTAHTLVERSCRVWCWLKLHDGTNHAVIGGGVHPIAYNHCRPVVVDSHAYLDKPVIGADLAQLTGNRIHHPKALSFFSQALGAIGQQMPAADSVITLSVGEV